MLNISNGLLTVVLLFAVSSIPITMGSSEESEEVITGGWTQEDVDSDTIKEFAQKAVNKLNQQSNDQYIVNKILSAKSQVVAGTNYKIKAEFGRITCKKGEVCDEDEYVQSTTVYKIRVFDQPSTQTERITFIED
ncbi:Cystatin domain-containing protein [Aphelenchoides besseyi]|nr:Cystatin domain-containing protein [Aphelenchoides besseyi]KAI6199158.1 Cystatin domain-containing protein [Aphelenchoides besseyi]